MTLFFGDGTKEYRINEDTMTFIDAYPGSPISFVPDGVIEMHQAWIDDKNIYGGQGVNIYSDNYTTLARFKNIALAGASFQGVVADTAQIYAIDGNFVSTFGLKVYDKALGTLLAQYLTNGAGLLQLNLPTNMTWDGTNLIICEQNNARISIRPTANLNNAGAVKTIAVPSVGGPVRSVAVDTAFIYIGYERVVLGNFVTRLAKYDRTTLLSVLDVPGPTAGGAESYVPWGATVDDTYVYFAYQLNSVNGPIVKYDKSFNEIARVASTNTGNVVSLASTRWWNMMFVPKYTQIVGGGSSRRYKPRPSLYTPFNSDPLP